MAEIVWVATGATATKKIFHVDTECEKVQGANLGERRREVMESWGYRVCDNCGDVENDPGGKPGAKNRPSS